MNNGWIKLYRKTKDSGVWKNLNPSQKVILITCLLLANHEENEWEWKGEVYNCLPGEFITSFDSLRKEAGKCISVQSCRTALLKLAKWHFLTIESTKTGTKIKIDKWEQYQSDQLPINKQINKQPTKHQQSINKDLTTNKNDKNEKNISNTNTSNGRGNDLVNLVLETFKKLYGFAPTDKKPRFVAHTLSKQLITLQKKRGKYVEGQSEPRAILGYFSWISKQDWAENIQTLDTVRRKLPIFESNLGGTDGIQS